MSNNSQFWIIGLVVSLLGIILIFISWFDCRILVASAGYNALEMAFSDAFQKGGFWENFDTFGRYCPMIFSVLAVVNCVLFLLAKDGTYNRMIIAISIVMISLAIYLVLCINPMSSSAGSRSPGAAVYLGISVGVISALIGYFGNKGIFYFVYEKKEPEAPNAVKLKQVKNKYGSITIEFLEAPAAVGNAEYYVVEINGIRESNNIPALQTATFRLFSGKNNITIEIYGDSGMVRKEFHPSIELGDRFKVLADGDSFDLVRMRKA